MSKRGSRYGVYINRKSEKQKNFWTREMDNPTGEEIGVDYVSDHGYQVIREKVHSSEY